MPRMPIPGAPILVPIEAQTSLSAAVAAAVIGTWDWHIQDNRVYADERFAQTFGVDPTSAAAGAPIEDFIAGIHPDDRARVQQKIVAAVASGHFYAEEYRVIGADNTVRWVLARGRCLKNSMGNAVRFSGAVTDITERKQSEEADRLIAAELHHRFRNLLTMIQAIVLQTLHDDTTLEAGRETLLERLSAAAPALSALTGRTQHAPDLHALISAAVAGAGDLRRFRIDGPKITVGAQQALALSLAFHELTTNATKYGALFNEEGLVTCDWTLDRAAGALLVEWREQGGPPVSPPRKRGFGSFMIEQNVAHELAGRVTVDYDSAGLRWRLTAPLARLG